MFYNEPERGRCGMRGRPCSCAFTGHRPAKLPWGDDERDIRCVALKARLRAAVEDYFKLELGRPEILNRIGENIVIFDFIRQEAGKAILRGQVDKLIRRLKEQKNLTLVVPDESYAQLSDAALADLSNGGRGIGNQVEALLINPLARTLFDSGVTEHATVTVDAFDPAAQPPALKCTIEKEEQP